VEHTNRTVLEHAKALTQTERAATFWDLINKSTCHVVSKRVPENELMGFDTMSNVTIYTNRRYVEEIRRLAEPIEVETMSGIYQLKYSATAKLDGKEVYFAPGQGINIQAAYQYKSSRRIADDGHDYLVLNDGEEIHFYWTEHLAVAHLEPIINRLEKRGNRAMATELRRRPLNQREIDAATRARDFKELCMNRSTEDIIKSINNGVISGIRVSAYYQEDSNMKIFFETIRTLFYMEM